MIFTNINILTKLLFLIIIIIISYYIFYSFKKQNKILPSIFLSISILLIGINIFQIKWNIKNDLDQKHFGSKILFALDISKSMRALDYKDWEFFVSRLNMSKNIIYNLLKKQDEYWLIIFSWESLEILPFSQDIWLFKTIVSWVDDKNVSKYWTNLWELFLSINDFFTEENKWWIVVVFTDWWDGGESLDTNLINNFKKKNIKIIFVWIWSKKWSYIPNWKDFFWNIIYKTYRWEKVITKLNEKKLKNISDKYNFDYFEFNNIGNIDDLSDFISKRLELVWIKNDDFTNAYDFTRLISFLSFVFFILYLIFNTPPQPSPSRRGSKII